METSHKLSWTSKKKLANKHAKRAKLELQRARILLEVQFKSYQDPKMFLMVIDSLHLATIEIMLAKLAKKRIGVKSKNSSVVLTVYLKNFQGKKEGNTLVWLTTLKRAHKNSPMCFRRKEVYVICNDSLEMATVTEEKLEDKLKIVKEFAKENKI